MPLYFLLHDAARFHQEIRPALSATWRRRSFEPARPLCAALAPAAVAFAERYHTGHDESLLSRVAGGAAIPFDRDVWRLLVGEVLLYGAASVPELLTAPDTLAHLLAAGEDEAAPIRQAHHGTHPLVFDGGFYRPDAAGFNDVTDVARLADYLAAVEAARWTAGDLAGLCGFADDEERAEELEFAREVLPHLAGMYREAGEARQVVVCEEL
jgi:hypothetical protein